MNIPGIKSANEVELDKEAIKDLMHMYRNVSSIKIAREAFLSMALCGPFTFHIPALGLVSNHDMSRVIERHWMPWQRKVYDWIKILGICPYYFKKLKGQHLHQVPVVPDMELGYITVSVTDDHELKYHWYWRHGYHHEEDKAILWVITDHAPCADGIIKSTLASLLPQYRTLLVLQKSLEIASAQSAELTHVLEYHPDKATAKSDNLTQMVANFGATAAGQSKARQDMARNNDIRVKTSELLRQVHNVQAANISNGYSLQKRVLWTDTAEDALERMDTGFANRVIPLRPDFKYISPAKPSVVADLDKHLTSFNTAAAAVMDFAMELIHPTGSARTQNVKGSERYENERIKEMLGFFTSITQTALIIAYRRHFEEGFDAAKQWRVNKHGGDHNAIADLMPELDVFVDMSCTPMMTYMDLKEMWMDGIMSKETFAHHAFHMRSLPEDQIKLSKLPDMVPKEMLPQPKSQGPPKRQKITEKA